MVMFEYIPYGDLLGFLKRSRGLDDKYYKDPDVKPSSSLKSKQLLKYAREIADGMAYLAENKVNEMCSNFKQKFKEGFNKNSVGKWSCQLTNTFHLIYESY